MDALQWMGAVRMRVQIADKTVKYNASSSEKVFWSESGEKSAQIKQRLQAKTALNKYVAGFWCERQQEMRFFTGGSVIMDYGLIFELKNILMLDLFQLLSSLDVNWWTGVVWITCGLLWCFYQLFGLSFWRHPFTAEHPLLRDWCRHISPNLMKKQTHPNLGRPEGEHTEIPWMCLNRRKLMKSEDSS